MAIKKLDEDFTEYLRAQTTFLFTMATIENFVRQGRSPASIGFEVGIAYPYYEQLIISSYLRSKKNQNRKLVLIACKKFEKYLDDILPWRKILK